MWRPLAHIAGHTFIVATTMFSELLSHLKRLGAQAERVKEITGGGAQFALVCVGVKQVVIDAPQALRIGGVCGIIGDPGIGIDATYNIAELLAYSRTSRH
jgi:aryl-alcohol dehydrogenase